jgi:hypothetical protein
MPQIRADLFYRSNVFAKHIDVCAYIIVVIVFRTVFRSSRFGFRTVHRLPSSFGSFTQFHLPNVRFGRDYFLPDTHCTIN